MKTILFLVQDPQRKLTLVEVVGEKINTAFGCENLSRAREAAKLSRDADNGLSIFTIIPERYINLLSNYTQVNPVVATSFVYGLQKENITGFNE